MLFWTLNRHATRKELKILDNFRLEMENLFLLDDIWYFPSSRLLEAKN